MEFAFKNGLALGIHFISAGRHLWDLKNTFEDTSCCWSTGEGLRSVNISWINVQAAEVKNGARVHIDDTNLP